MQKKCKKCNQEKSLESFSKQKTNSDGYKNLCKNCIAEYGRSYRSNNIEKEKERSKNYYKNNKEKRKLYFDSKKDEKAKYAKKYRIVNKELIKKKRKLFYIKNKEKIRIKNKKYYNSKIDSNFLFKLKKETQGLIRDSLRRKNLKKEYKRTVDILGCSIKEFKLYLENKFEKWMNWGNKGLYNGTLNYGWDIDHIIPICTAKTKEEILKLNHYTNLQPLCSYVNRVLKSGKH